MEDSQVTGLKRCHSASPPPPSTPPSTPPRRKKFRISSPHHRKHVRQGFSSPLASPTANRLPGEKTDAEIIQEGFEGSWLKFLCHFGLKPNPEGYAKGKRILKALREIDRVHNTKWNVFGGTVHDSDDRTPSRRNGLTRRSRSPSVHPASSEPSRSSSVPASSPPGAGNNSRSSSVPASDSSEGSNRFRSSSIRSSGSGRGYRRSSPNHGNVIVISSQEDADEESGSDYSQESFDQERNSSGDENHCFDEQGEDYYNKADGNEEYRQITNDESDGENTNSDADDSGYIADSSSLHLDIYDIENPDDDNEE